MIDFLASTGIRVGKLVLLNRDDINFQERECIVFGKRSKERVAYFDARTKLHLQKYLSSRDDNDSALFVSLNKKHTRLTIGGVESRLKSLGQKVGIANVYPHKFRRTLATTTIDKGMPIEQLQQLLGHKKIDTPLHYAMVKQQNVKIAHRKYIGGFNLKVKLRDYAQLVNSRVGIEEADESNYISTDNMLPNRGGIKFCQSNLPKAKTVNDYQNGDILVSNIRPYFKKIWFSDRKGTRSGDVLCFRKKGNNILGEYLYCVLQSDHFFNYVVSTSKGTKMPRGDKQAILDYEFDLPDKEEQYEKYKSIMLIEEKIHLNSQINDNLSDIQLLNISNLINKKLYEISRIKDLEITVSDHVANGSFKALKDNVTYFDNPNYALFVRNVDFKDNLSGNKRYIDKESYNFLKKSHLFGGEVVISNVADVGSVHRVPFIKKPMVVGNNQIFIKSKDHTMTDYLYAYFQSFWGQSAISSITSGSAQQKFNKTDFRSLEIPIPTENWIQNNITPYVTLQDKIFIENQSLEQIKITLLNHYF